MPTSNAFRQVDEKHVSSEAHVMCWSPKMDLIALANVQGEVVLHRLSWQKVWSLGPPTEGDMVVALAWRPDGKVVGVGYSSGDILLCDVEDCSILHTRKLSATLASLTWLERCPMEDKQDQDQLHNSGDSRLEDFTEKIFRDQSNVFLPELPQFNKTFSPGAKGSSEENYDDLKKLKNQKELNILVAGTEDGRAHLLAYGVFPVGVVDLNSAGMSGIVTSAHLSHDLHLLVLLVEAVMEDGETTEVVHISFDTMLLASRHAEIRTLALKFGHIASQLHYLESTIQQMTEAWEDILLEMDSKLAKFAEDKRRVCGGSVSNDFLRLLLFGVPSDELQNFLLHELTEKGLKKLGHSIETSYSNIQKLVLKHLQSVGQALTYHLSDIRGMAHWYDKFGVLGVTLETVETAISNTGSFMLKASELQQVIDGGMKNFKAFFRRLYVVIQRLSDEQIPPELTKMTQQEINFVAQFLSENFTEQAEEGKSGFKLEKVGQYLKAEDLVDPPDNSQNPWIQFLNQTPKVKESNILYPVRKEKSLVQMHNMLLSAIQDIQQKCSSVIGQSFQCVSVNQLYRRIGEVEDSRKAQFSKDVEGVHYVYSVFTTEAPPCEKCFLVRQPTVYSGSVELEATSFKVTTLTRSTNQDESSASLDNICTSHKIQDVRAYDEQTLSILVTEDSQEGTPVLLQLPLNVLEERLVKLDQQQCMGTLVDQVMPIVEIDSNEEELSWRHLDNMRACQIAVSGTRKVACVLFSSRRRVRLLMLDAEDEDEDDVTQLHDVTNPAAAAGDVTGQSSVLGSEAAGAEEGAGDREEGVMDDNEGLDEDKENSPETSGVSGIDV